MAVLTERLAEGMTMDTLNGKVNSDPHCEFDSIQEAIDALARGEFILVVDNEDRENEGDLIIAAEKCTTEAMAFLIRYSSGYVCVPTTDERLKELDLPLMVPKNTELMRTAYTISVDYKHGTTTGISAHDRALTARKLADPTTTPDDFSRPGHILPLRAVPGGVMHRFGHTEASVDFCKLAGLAPVAVIGELVKENDPQGGMARRDDCKAFAERWNLRMTTQATVKETAEESLKPTEDSLGFTTTAITQAGRPIYLDMQATSPMDPRVVDAMMPYMTQFYGNPHSRTHQYGWESEKATEEARKHVADLVGADPKEIIFTSGATESNNLSIKGVARFYKGKKKHIITTQTEHKCVLDSCRVLQEEGFDVTYLPVKPNGLIDLEEFEKSIRPDTAIVSIMAVNNEIGVIQPIAEIGKICREKKVFFHTDAAQAVGKIPVDVNTMNVDLMSISGHKIYGPKGIGAIYVRRRPRVRLEAVQSGGGQERGIRSGTVPTPLCVGLGEACRIAKEEMAYDHKRISALSERLINGIQSQVTDVVRNGLPESTYPGCVNLSFSYVEGESLLMALKDIALSSGSACTSASLEPSYVLRALGADDEMAHSSIRFGIGRFTTEEEIDFVVNRVVQHVDKLREMSPLWEMVQEGIDLKSIQWSQH
ncbi:Cysteine desulfurase, mitochondrial [Bifiguratus adelaidae]|uniref:3,4-dihydroxy-2-butanone 4-phosphate synthase n=1 Tax=Bifiguratus adelaidae TaxID=1938954 RepID=A0A261XYH0_9FUNG|nr:Cysteine desulfurase, mitochondrial [Bifiguratus adelaidae]